ncbi:MAG TPA: RNA polymerase factor sigma-54 [Gammaproteobacteria bacterium]
MLKPSLQLKLSQQLTMTPQLQQAIRLLQLPIVDLQAQIQEALDENVMLEIDEEASFEAAEESPAADTTPEELELSDVDWADTQRTGPSDTPTQFDSGIQPEYADLSEDTLRDHLLWQLELENLDSRTTAIGQAIIDGINEDGYLNDEIEAIKATLAPDIAATAEEIEAVLGLVQRLDPAGVGARSVGECVLLQLRQLDPVTPGLGLAKAVAGEHLELVAERRFSLLKKLLDATDEELDDALLLVRACHPRPGSSITASTAEYVVPDVYVRRSDGAWIVELNPTAAPRLRVNQSYAGSLGRTGEYDVLRTQLQEARWLIRSLEIRNETLLKVAKTIVARQVDFFEHGEEHMRPMILKDVAEAIEMHESTVSRVTTNKYMHTPRGIFELRYFFSSHLTSDDGDQSSTAVRAKIRKMIGGETPEKPLSDNQIAKLLSDEGIQVARRTVAKYREGMKIPSSSERKRSKLAG